MEIKEERFSMIRILLALACSLAFLVGLASCSGDGTTLGPSGTPDTTVNGDNGDNGENGDNGDTAVTLATLSAEIFTPNCAVSGCHAGPNASNGMSLEAGLIADEIIGVTSTRDGSTLRIAPGDPDNSLIVQKVRGEAGSQMPLSAPALSDEAIAKIIEWIEAGANP
jgi:hypothetical protein